MKSTANALSRRQFIQITAAGVGLAGGAGLHSLKQLLADPKSGLARIHQTRLLLGTIANLTLFSDDPALARTAVRAAFDRMAALESVLSRFQPDSQISELNRTGQLTNAHPALRAVLSRAIYWGELTSGAFDVSIEPVLALYRTGAQSGYFPEAEQIAAARLRVDYRQIAISEHDVQLGIPDMAVTVDGIGKGYIIDQGIEVLAQYGFGNVMVELGGDLHARGQAGTRPWHVGIQQPSQPTGAESPPQNIVAQVVNHALATSGDYMQAYTDDRRLHHIIDPASGISPGDLSSASVLAPNACDADALATAMLVMGAGAGLSLIERLPDTEALVISKDGSMRHSANFPI